MTLTHIIIGVCVIIGIILTKTIVPWVQSKTSNEDFQTIYQWILVGCKAADQLVKSGQLTKEERKEHVIQFLQDNGFLEGYDLGQIVEIIESICLDLPSITKSDETNTPEPKKTEVTKEIKPKTSKK